MSKIESQSAIISVRPTNLGGFDVPILLAGTYQGQILLLNIDSKQSKLNLVKSFDELLYGSIW